MGQDLCPKQQGELERGYYEYTYCANNIMLGAKRIQGFCSIGGLLGEF